METNHSIVTWELNDIHLVVVRKKCFLVWILWHWFTFDVWLNTCLHFCISFMYLSKVNTRCFKIVYLGPTFFYHWLISRVSLQYVFSDGEWGDGCGEILCHIPYMSNISLQYEFSDVKKDLNSGERLCHSLYIYQVSPQYGFIDVEKDVNNG